MSLAQKIVFLRKQHNLTQKDFAKSIGVHFSHMSRYERDISLPSVDVIKKIAQVFNVTTDYLLRDDAAAVLETNIADPELLELFTVVSRMPEKERAAIKVVLESMVVKHQITQLLEEHTSLDHAAALLQPSAPVLRWKHAERSTGLRQQLDGALSSRKQ
jgi:transcriptional regulator with XRE-family HTH domain